VIKLSEGDVRRYFQNALYNREHRLVLISLPKVASTAFDRLMIRMLGVKDWTKHPYHRPERPRLSMLGPEEVSNMMNSPEWTRAVFLRDPLDRLLSAYLHLFENNTERCEKLFGIAASEMSFSRFVHGVTGADPRCPENLRISKRCNVHWMPQSYIGHMQEYIQCLNFVGSFNYLEIHSKLLLTHIGAWEKYGASGWGSDGKQRIFQQNDAVNRRDAQSKIFQYYTDELIIMVRDAYRMDYEMIESLGIGTSSSPAISW